jgi:hypothetical protein
VQTSIGGILHGQSRLSMRVVSRDERTSQALLHVRMQCGASAVVADNLRPLNVPFGECNVWRENGKGLQLPPACEGGG